MLTFSKYQIFLIFIPKFLPRCFYFIAGTKDLLTYAEQVREFLGVPDGYKLVALVPIGYPAEKQRKNKRSLAEVTHWEAWITDKNT